MLNLDLMSAFAVLNVLSGLLVLWVMQRVTFDAGFQSALGLVKLIHRTVLGLLAVVLVWNGCYTLDMRMEPRWIDVVVESTFLVVLWVSAWRHSMAPNTGGSPNMTVFRAH